VHPICPRDDEQGFVLITALWLLLLSGAIVALMLLRSAGKAQANRAASQQAQMVFDMDAAVTTVAADLLFRGDQSRWARAPGDGTIDIDGRTLSVRVSSENGRLDLNDGDLTVIDRGLQGLGVAADIRARTGEALRSARARNDRIASPAELNQLLAEAGAGRILCLDDDLTLYSGLGRPDESVMPAELARALAIPQAAGEPFASIRPGMPIRLRITTAQGPALTAVIRVVGTMDRAYDVMRWTSGPNC